MSMLLAGCGNPSMAVINQTSSPLQVEVSIAAPGYRLFTREQNYRFRLVEGQRWDSIRAESDQRVEWNAADGVQTGLRIHTREMGYDEAILCSLSNFTFATVTISGAWPDFQFTAQDERGDDIPFRLLFPGSEHWIEPESMALINRIVE